MLFLLFACSLYNIHNCFIPFCRGTLVSWKIHHVHITYHSFHGASLRCIQLVSRRVLIDMTEMSQGCHLSFVPRCLQVVSTIASWHSWCKNAGKYRLSHDVSHDAFRWVRQRLLDMTNTIPSPEGVRPHNDSQLTPAKTKM